MSNSKMIKLNERNSLKEVRIVNYIGGQLEDFSINNLYTANISSIDNDEVIIHITDDKNKLVMVSLEEFETNFKNCE